MFKIDILLFTIKYVATLYHHKIFNTYYDYIEFCNGNYLSIPYNFNSTVTTI